jgi:hypothetical protein
MVAAETRREQARQGKPRVRAFIGSLTLPPTTRRSKSRENARHLAAPRPRRRSLQQRGGRHRGRLVRRDPRLRGRGLLRVAPPLRPGRLLRRPPRAPPRGRGPRRGTPPRGWRALRGNPPRVTRWRRARCCTARAPSRRCG